MSDRWVGIAPDEVEAFVKEHYEAFWKWLLEESQNKPRKGKKAMIIHGWLPQWLKFKKLEWDAQYSSYSLKKEPLWYNNETCPECGSPANAEIKACETGFNYCSEECARTHVNRS